VRLPARSIRRDLVTWLAAGLLAAIASAAIATYLRAREEANVLFDYQLQQMAASITGMPLAGPPLGGTPGANALVVQVWDRNGVQVFLSQPQASLPRHAQLGYNTVSTGAGEWRVFSTLAGGQVVQVAQPLSVRRSSPQAWRCAPSIRSWRSFPFWRCWSGSVSRAACVRCSA
jgi:two-component system OmpR family sensor kinase